MLAERIYAYRLIALVAKRSINNNQSEIIMTDQSANTQDNAIPKTRWPNNKWLRLVIDVVIRILIASVGVAVGFWLALISTMGPAIKPDVGDGQLDMWIRMSMLGGGAILALGITIWSVWSIYRLITQAINEDAP